jgi:hypothetical protein
VTKFIKAIFDSYPDLAERYPLRSNGSFLFRCMYRRWHCFMYMNDQVVAELVPVMKEQWDEWKRTPTPAQQTAGVKWAAAGRSTLAEMRENPVEKERLAKALRPNAATAWARALAALDELRENPVEKERLAEAVRPNIAKAIAAISNNSLRKVKKGWKHVELDPPWQASEAEKAAAELQGTWTMRRFITHHLDEQNGPFIYKQKPFKAHEKEQLVNEIVFHTRNRIR